MLIQGERGEGNGQSMPRLTCNSLAYAEMRYIVARLIWNFEIEIAEQSRQWADGLRAWLIWEKRPLHVYLKRREQAVMEGPK